MTIIKNGCICGGDYYTTSEQCNNMECRSERRKNKVEEFETIEEKARKILFTWSKENLIDDILNITSKEGLREFVEDNS